MTRYLVTGGAGFVGANLVFGLLSKPDAEIFLLLKPKTNTWRLDHVLPNPRLHILEVDLLERKKLQAVVAEIRPQVIYHLAAHGAYPVQDNATEIFQTNIFSTLNLLHATKTQPYELFVHAGSSSEYGFKDQPMCERDICVPNSYYAISKLASTNLCSYTAMSKNKPIVTLRFFSVFGPYEESSRLLPTLLRALQQNKVLALTAPETARDFVYVDDVISLLLEVARLKKQSGKVFNLGTGRQTSLRELVAVCESVAQLRLQARWGKYSARAWDTQSWAADMTLTKKMLSWLPKNDLKSGLSHFWHWYQKNFLLYEA